MRFDSSRLIKLVAAIALVALSVTDCRADPLALREQFGQAEFYRDNGNYFLAEQKFREVLAKAEQQQDLLMQAMATGALGYSYYLVRADAKAEALLQKALLLARPLGYPGLTALLQNYLGMLQLALANPSAATNYFQNALTSANLTTDPTLQLSIRINQAKLDPNPVSQCGQLQNLLMPALELPNTTAKGYLLLNMAEQLLAGEPENCSQTGALTWSTMTYKILDEALQVGRILQQFRLQAQAQAYLAKLYQRQQQAQDALLWLEHAIFSAQKINASDLLTQFETERGYLLQQLGNSVEALAAYRRAVHELTNIQSDLPLYLHDGESSMAQLVDPAYRGLADLLLLQARQTHDATAQQNLIKEAVMVMEYSKQAELEDFFKDRCLIDSPGSINLLTQQVPDVAILYPVIFADRIEILFRLGQQERIQQASFQINKSQLSATVLLLNERLRHGKDYRSAAYQLYDWLLRPFSEQLKAHGVKTLIYIPDGMLRQVPVAALNDGQNFIVENYASVTLPGLVLQNSVKLQRSVKHNALIAALSKPDGPSVDQLSPEYLKSLRQGLNNARETPVLKIPALSPRENLVTELSLPGIEREVALLQQKMPNTTLLNQAFTFQDFKQSINSGAYSVVHIASHGYFGKHAEDSFIMAYDRNVKLTEFQSLLDSGKPNQPAIELLTLNACETAGGDDRALLGFTGMAIRTNTQSAIGTLWPINDDAAVKFMGSFYDRFGGVESKAEVLRQAQLSLLKDKKFSHPYFWSPFIMVGNWQ